MDLDMFSHFSTRENLQKLAENKIKVIDPGEGELASGLEGKGRMEEPEVIARMIHEYFNVRSKLNGKKVLITGGPTNEAIDPVRFIGNHSSGKTGVLLADLCADRGAEVILVSGPTVLKPKNPYVKFISVQSANEMMEVVARHWPASDIGIFSAAVADYRPWSKADQKIKKDEDELTIKLVKNPDILKWAGENKQDKQYLVGFALETNNAEENAQKKLTKKNLDLLVLNTLEDEGAGFGLSTNKVSILRPGNFLTKFELKDKSEVVRDILDEIEKDIA